MVLQLGRKSSTSISIYWCPKGHILHGGILTCIYIYIFLIFNAVAAESEHG